MKGSWQPAEQTSLALDFSTSEGEPLIHTIGHSTHSIEKFIALLHAAGVKCLVDVRSYPTSFKFPQFCQQSLQESLSEAGIRYAWLGKNLGGLRVNGYREYMLTPSFLEGLQSLKEEAARLPTCIMCAEVLFQRCHRRFIADALSVDNWMVLHIMGDGKQIRHRPNPHE